MSHYGPVPGTTPLLPRNFQTANLQPLFNQPATSSLNHLADVFANLTLGMLISDAGLIQFTNATTTVGNLSEQLAVQLNASAAAVTDAAAADSATSTTTSMDEFFAHNMTTVHMAAAAAAAHERDSLMVLVPVTIVYLLIFVAGLLGNVITCTVISRNKSMHTATNYYLFNLAISDLMLLMSGLPVETYNIWYPAAYPVSQSLCILQGLLSETSANATVLTITSFTVERYIAICHPFRQHTMSKLSRAIRFIMFIWFLAFCLAIPQACQFGVVVNIYGGSTCTVKNVLVEHAFEMSSFVFFVGPMTLICVLYVLIGFKLHKSKLLQGVKRRGVECGSTGATGRSISGQTRVIRMLVAVAVAFFLCWAPFHAQRVMAVYGKTTQTTNALFRSIYSALTYVSGVLYFLSTCINPLLYSIMSHKFRDAFKTTLARQFGLRTDHKKCHTYSALSKCGNGHGSIRLTASLLPGGNNGAGGGGGITGPQQALNQRHANLMQTTQMQPQQKYPTSSMNFLTAVTVHSTPLPATDDLNNSSAATNVQSSGDAPLRSHANGQAKSLDSVAFNSLITSTQPPVIVQTMPPSNSTGNGASAHYHTHCLIHSRCPHHSYQRHRCISVSSQATQQTSVASRQHDEANGGGGDGTSAAGRIMPCHQQHQPAETADGATMPTVAKGNGIVVPITRKNASRTALGSIAEKLRRGTRKVLQFTSGGAGNNSTSNNCNNSSSSQHCSSSSCGSQMHHVASAKRTACKACTQTAESAATASMMLSRVDGAGVGADGQPQQTKRIPKLQKLNSVDSAHTNTISNSSLQEVDAEEFDSAELAKHMGEINNEINAIKCSSVGGGIVQQPPVD